MRSAEKFSGEQYGRKFPHDTMIHQKSQQDRDALLFAMNLSLGVGIFMVLLKGGAYLLTGSSAILSDAAESIVHVAAVVFASYSLRLSFQPADERHHYGHAKISFFSVGFEGGMITIAALYILEASIQNWMTGIQIEHIGIGTVLTLLAIFINGVLGKYLIRLGKEQNSNILVANGHHTFTDCWTGIAVLTGLGFVLATKWLPFDPICGILMALNILRTGVSPMRATSPVRRVPASRRGNRRLRSNAARGSFFPRPLKRGSAFRLAACGFPACLGHIQQLSVCVGGNVTARRTTRRTE